MSKCPSLNLLFVSHVGLIWIIAYRIIEISPTELTLLLKAYPPHLAVARTEMTSHLRQPLLIPRLFHHRGLLTSLSKIVGPTRVWIHFYSRSEERRVGKEGRSRWSPY